jgi:hypothetical protein
MLASSHIAASFILEVVGAITDHQVATVGGERATVWVAGASSVRESLRPLHHTLHRLRHRLWWHFD